MFKLQNKQGQFAIAHLTGKPFEYSTESTAKMGKHYLEARDKCAYRIVPVQVRSV